MCDVYTEDRQQGIRHTGPSSPVVVTPVAGVTIRSDDNSHLGSQAPPSDEIYDDIGDVEVGDGVTAADSEGNLYDGLQPSTLDSEYQTSPVYEHIRSDATASATNPDVIAHQAGHADYLQLIGDDDSLPERDELTNTSTFHHKHQKCTAVPADTAAKASTL